MSSTRDNVSLYNNSQYNLLSFSQENGVSNINVDNQHISFIENFINEEDKEKIIENNFKWLELELLKHQRITSAFDYYKIDGSFSTIHISTVDLLKNHSLICTKALKLGDEQYVAGDLLYKQNNGQIQKIALGLGGIYIPQFIKDSTGFQIKWEWFLEKPENELDPIKMEFAENNYYGAEKDKPEIGWGTNAIDIVNITNLSDKIQWSKITPVIKGYHKNSDGKWEEVFWDYNIFLNGNNTIWKISSIPNYVDKVMVK